MMKTMTHRILASTALYDGDTLVFVGDPDLARHRHAARPTLSARDESVRLHVPAPRRVAVNDHELRVTAARSLAGLIERAVNDEREGTVAGVHVAAHDGVLQLIMPASVLHVDFEGALRLADLLRIVADEADPTAPDEA